jgi:tRNA 2-thiouridine synthesizing protein E
MSDTQTPNFETDAEGYLVDPAQWTEAIARELARREGLALIEDHWRVIRFMRDYYASHQIAADARFAIKDLAEVHGAAARKRLFELFPYGYVKQACKIAGMRRPRAWSTG